MKFITEAINGCGPRLGRLTEFERIPGSSFETPLALTYTRRGAVPHLTKDVFKLVTTDQQFLSVSLPTAIKMADAIKELKTSFSSFVSMQEHVSFLSIQDPAEATAKGFQKNNAIPVWTRTGKYLLNAEDYMNIVETFKPDLYVALCDSDTDVQSSTKRTNNAVTRSRHLLQECLKIHAASDVLKSKGILAAIEGGYNLEARKDSIEFTKDQPLDGFVIEGLHNNGPDVQNITLEQIEQVVKCTTQLLPAEKLKVSLGCWNPAVVLELVNLGVDVFDTSYVFITTENSQALIFLCDHESCNNTGHLLSVAEERYKDDFSPICKQCKCTACKEHTRAYLHHLYHTREMLCQVLLMIHNMHQYVQFFSEIRENLRKGSLFKYKEKISAKLGTTDRPVSSA